MKPTKQYVIDKYSLADQTSAEIRRNIPKEVREKLSLEVNVIISRIEKDKKVSEERTLRLAEFNAKFDVWKDLGSPADMICESGDVIGFNMAAKTGGG